MNPRLFRVQGLARFFASEMDTTVPYAKFVHSLTRIRIPEHYQRDLLSKVFTQTEALAETPADREPIAELPIKKSKEFCLARGDYDASFQADPFGAIELFDYKGHNLCVIGACYANLPAENLWKIMRLFGPHGVLLQLSPDDVLRDFSLNCRNPATDRFSNRLFFQQLELAGSETSLNAKVEAGVAERIRAKFLTDCPEAATSEQRCIPDYRSYNRLTDEAVATAVLFCRTNSLPLVLADLPDIIARQQLVNEMTVSELRRILETATVKSVLNPDYLPATPLFAAHLDYPELCLAPSDGYTASLVEYMIKRRPEQTNILVFAGNNQASSLKRLLKNRSVLTLHESLAVRPPKGKFYEEPTLEDLIEKLAIFDVLKFGKEIYTQKMTRFDASDALIRKHMPDRKTREEQEYFFYLHRQLVKRYLELFFEHYERGVRSLKLHFYQRAMEQKELKPSIN